MFASWGAFRPSYVVARRKVASILPALLAVGLLAGCTAFPRDTPDSKDIRADASVTLQSDERVAYALVNLTNSILPTANSATVMRRPNFSGLRNGGGGSFANVRISVGDILSITIFEAASGGLFIPSEAGSRAGNFVQVPNQQVDTSGMIEVPYAGSIKAAGRSAREVSEEIRRNLANRAIEPQVVVTINERRGNDVSVLGEVNTPSRFAMDPGGIRLMGAVARAGGPRYPTYESMVSIQRGGKTYKAMLSTVLNNPGLDIQLQSGDVVFLARDPQYFMVFGATPDPSGNNSRRVTFENDEMSLAEGLAKAGGLRTERADPQSLFIFRMEGRGTLERMGVDTTPYSGATIPTVYSINLRTADGIFMSNNFRLRDRDIVVAADAQTVDIGKFLGLVNQAAVVPYNAGVIATR